jgi:hypothetical protein
MDNMAFVFLLTFMLLVVTMNKNNIVGPEEACSMPLTQHNAVHLHHVSLTDKMSTNVLLTLDYILAVVTMSAS